MIQVLWNEFVAKCANVNRCISHFQGLCIVWIATAKKDGFIIKVYFREKPRMNEQKSECDYASIFNQ